MRTEEHDATEQRMRDLELDAHALRREVALLRSHVMAQGSGACEERAWRKAVNGRLNYLSQQLVAVGERLEQMEQKASSVASRLADLELAQRCTDRMTVDAIVALDVAVYRLQLANRDKAGPAPVSAADKMVAKVLAYEVDAAWRREARGA